MENLAHAVVVRNTNARGRIQSIDTSAAEKSPGVLAVITHLNAPKLATTDPPEVSDRYPSAMGKLRQLMPVLPQKLPQQQE